MKRTLFISIIGFSFILGFNNVFAQNWTPPTQLSDSSEYATHPHVAADKAGDTAIVWLSADNLADQSSTVKLSYRKAGSQQFTTTSIGKMDQIRNATPTVPQVAMNSHGDTVIVWRSRDLDNETVRITAIIRRSDGTFSSPEILSPADDNAGTPKIALDNNDGIHVIWNYGVSKNVIQYAFGSVKTGVFGNPITVSQISRGEWASSGVLSVNNRGDVAIAWVLQHPTRAVRGGQGIIQASFKPANASTFDSTIDVSTNRDKAASMGAPVIALNNHLFSVAWLQMGSQNDALYIAQSALSDSHLSHFTQPALLTLPGEGASSAQIANDAIGNTTIIWAQNAYSSIGTLTIATHHVNDSLGVFKRDQVFQQPDHTFLHASVAMDNDSGDSGGRSVVLWNDRLRGGNNLVIQAVSRVGEEKKFSQSYSLAKAWCAYAGGGSVASADNGMFVATWTGCYSAKQPFVETATYQ